MSRPLALANDVVMRLDPPDDVRQSEQRGAVGSVELLPISELANQGLEGRRRWW